MSPQIALDYLNAAKKSTYTLDHQFSGGENQGAYRVVNADGTGAVLKLSKNPLWRTQVERAKAATGHLRPLGYPVPEYLYIDATDTGTFWLESELPGSILINPTPEHATALLGFLDLQKAQVISEVQGQDWSSYVSSVVFRGESGLVRMLMQFSEETSALAAQIEGMVLGLEGKVLAQTDLVHGDFGISQVLATNNTITGVLDWDQVGYGDRTMDLVGLWYSLMNTSAARDIVLAHLKQVSDPQTIKIFAAYKMLSIVTWHINTPGGDVGTVTADVKTGLQQLQTL